MLNFGTLGALVIALIAIAPGYIASTLWLRNKTWERPITDLRLVLQSLVVSLVIQIIAAPVTILWLVPVKDELARHPWRTAAWAGLVVVVIPVILGIGGGRLSDQAQTLAVRAPDNWLGWLLRSLLPESPPSAWDDFFDSEITDGKFVIITLNDGTRLAGYFADPSYAMTSPAAQGIYVAEEWFLDKDNNFEREVNGTKGFLIPSAAAIKTIQIRESADEWAAELKEKEV